MAAHRRLCQTAGSDVTKSPGNHDRMQKPAIPSDEQERLNRLRALDVIYTPATRAYDDITRLARLRFGTAFALVSLITEDQQWFKAADGLDACSTHRDVSFCGHAIHGENVFVVEDALLDPRFADNPLVTGPPHIRFYAGYPLRTGPGSALGTLCIIDTEPREFDDSDARKLVRFGSMVENLLQEREQMLDLASDALGTDRALSRWDLIDPLTGNWKFAAAEKMIQVSLAHARESDLDICALAIRFKSLAGEVALELNPDVRMILKEGARQIRDRCPPQSAHFHDGHGNFVALALSQGMGSANEIGQGVVRELELPTGWDLVPCQPPAFDHQILIFSPEDRASAGGLDSLFRLPA